MTEKLTVEGIFREHEERKKLQAEFDRYNGIVRKPTARTSTSSQCKLCGGELSGSYSNGTHTTCPEPVPPTQPAAAQQDQPAWGQWSDSVLTRMARAWLNIERDENETDESLRSRCLEELWRPPFGDGTNLDEFTKSWNARLFIGNPSVIEPSTTAWTIFQSLIDKANAEAAALFQSMAVTAADPASEPVTITSAAQAREFFGHGHYDSWFRPSPSKIVAIKLDEETDEEFRARVRKRLSELQGDWSNE
jgi:hypothetical protein